VCGICGFRLSADQSDTEPEQTLHQMVSAIRHRGPDEQGIYLHQRVGLGHARLSIIDLAAGQQPIFNEDNTIAVVFNGEIYNFAELREKLISQGHRFRTNTDTEVLVHLWEQYGRECVSQLRGMFAFVIHDQRQNVLFGARDRFGQKPLYYHHSRGNFAFASEIKALFPLPFFSRKIDPIALDQFLFYQFVPSPRSMFSDVQTLPPAHTFLLEADKLTTERYWQPEFASDTNRSNMKHLADVETAIIDAVESHLVSDVPVGVFLSGGIDSSLIAAFANRHRSQPLKSFSIAFPEERYDESPHARLASEHIGTEHHEFLFEPHDVIARIEKLVQTFDQPLADRSALPLQMLCEQTAQHVKVVLTGDGGDELFGGYEKYQQAEFATRRLAPLFKTLSSLFSSSKLGRCAADRYQLRRLCSRIAYQYYPLAPLSYYKHYWEGWDRHALFTADLAQQLQQSFTATDAILNTYQQPEEMLNQMLQLDQLSYLPDDLLLKTDFSTMAYGLESRAPFLDHELATVAGRLPTQLKTTREETKIALRRIAAKYLPASITERPKRGFAVPVRRWFKQQLKDWVSTCLIDESSTVGSLFQKKAVQKILSEHNHGLRNHASKIYSLLVFELWYRHYIENASFPLSGSTPIRVPADRQHRNAA